MAAKTTAKTKSVATEVENVVAEPAVETIDQLKSNMIALANDLCERVRGKAIETDMGVDKIVALYNAVKQVIIIAYFTYIRVASDKGVIFSYAKRYYAKKGV